MLRKLILGGFCFLIGAGLAFFGMQFFLKTGFFKVPGKLIIEGEVSNVEQYTKTLAEIELDKDMTISEYLSDKNITHKAVPTQDLVESVEEVEQAQDVDDAKYYLTDILVPVADFYEPKESITGAEFEERLASGEGVTSVLDLAETQKLLAVDGNYWLDDFTDGAKYKILKVEAETVGDMANVTELLTPLMKEFPSSETVLSFTQTGVTALGRNMYTKMAQVGVGAYFSANIAEYLRKFDLTHTSNESSFSYYASVNNICSDWRFLDTLIDIGLDIVELTGNHNIDCGAGDAISTFEKYQELGIKTVGGGRTAEEAEIPLVISQKGTNITMLAYNQSTGGATLGATPGANQYYAENAMARIAEAKERGDFVIVDVQYNECNFYDDVNENTYCDRADSAPGDQVGLFRSLIDMGANIVVGTSAHQTQTYEQYNGGEIYYGLGNIFFDQVWWPGTTRSLGLTHYFWNGRLLQTRRFGTVYDTSYQTRVMNTEEIEWLINRLNQAR
ncbi:CapA family protein [Candidatus Saccharibacteria bacterium]|nr:CapA family protein [Candidatus Saccharibacteria bacterium]